MQDTPFYSTVEFVWEKINELYKGKWKKTKKKFFDYAMNDLIAYIIADVSLEYSLFYQKLNEEEKEKFFDMCTECKNIYLKATAKEAQKIFACIEKIGDIDT